MIATAVLLGAILFYTMFGFVLGYLGKKEIIKKARRKDISLWRKIYWIVLFPFSSSVVLWLNDSKICDGAEFVGDETCSLTFMEDDHISASMLSWMFFYGLALYSTFFYLVAASIIRLLYVVPLSFKSYLIRFLLWCSEQLDQLLTFITLKLDGLERRIEQNAKNSHE